MPRRRKGARVLGPYEHYSGLRFREIAVDGSSSWSPTFATEEEAEEYRAEIEAALVTRQLTTGEAIDQYIEHLEAEGNKSASNATTRAALEAFFPDEMPLWGLRERFCQERYDALVAATKIVKDEKKNETEVPRYAVATHRNYLSQVKTFLAWCVEAGLLRQNPATTIKGVGRRRKGKKKLRIRHTRAWYEKAIELAESGDDGALAALVALMVGLRASEICRMRVGDLDQEELEGDTLWIDEAKSDAGRRALEVLDPLRSLLLEHVKGWSESAFVFPVRGRRGKPLKKPHWRDWPRAQVHRVCDAAGVPRVTAHAMRGMLADIGLRRSAPRVPDYLGHDDERTTNESYAGAGAAEAGERRRGMKILKGGKK